MRPICALAPAALAVPAAQAAEPIRIGCSDQLSGSPPQDKSGDLLYPDQPAGR